MAAPNPFAAPEDVKSDGAAAFDRATARTATELVGFDFTTTTANTATSFLGLYFVDVQLEADYARFVMHDRSARTAGAVLLAWTVYMAAVLGFFTRDGTPYSLSTGLAWSAVYASVLLGAPLVAMPPTSPHAVFALLGTCLAWAATSGTVIVDLIVCGECVKLRDELSRSDARTACHVRLSGLVIVVQLVVALFSRLPTLSRCAIIAWSTILFLILKRLGGGSAALAGDPQAFPLMCFCHIACGVAAVILGSVQESTLRFEFLRSYMRNAAQRKVAAHKDSMGAITRVALPEHLSWYARTAVSMDALRTAAGQATEDAFVCAIEVVNSSAWSMTAVPSAVIDTVSTLHETFDVGLGMFDVRKAGTFADTYFAECGLLARDRGSLQAIRGFTSWAVYRGNALGGESQPQYTVRAAIAGGKLMGGVVGDASLRYVVSGPALADALFALRTAPRSQSIVDTVQHASTALRNESFHHDAPQAEARASSLPPLVRSATPSADDDLEHRLSTTDCIGRYTDPGVTPLFARFVEQEETLYGPYPTAAYLLVAAVFLAACAADRGARAGSAWRPLDGASFAAAPFALVYPIARLVLLVRSKRVVPLLADVTLCGVAMLALLAALVLTPQRLSLFTNEVMPVCAMMLGFCGAMVRRTHWITQVGLSVALVGPTWLAGRLLGFDDAPVIRLWRVPAVVILLVAFWFTTMSQKRRFVTCCLGEATMAHEVGALRTQRQVLERLVPQPLVAETLAHLQRHAAPQQSEGGGHRLRYGVHDMACIAIRLSRAPGHDGDGSDGAESTGTGSGRSTPSLSQVGAPVPGRWCRGQHSIETLRDVAAVVEHHAAGRFGIVYLVADRILIAGPFRQESSAALGDTVRAMVTALRDLHKTLARRGVLMHAACDVDTAYGALVGNAHRTYDLFGPAVRTAGFILRASPPLGANNAFATESFVRMCYFDERAFVHLNRAIEPTDPNEPTILKDFSPVMRWRSRDAGVLRVRSLRLDLPNGSSDDDDDDSDCSVFSDIPAAKDHTATE